jgi:hypothetical protein
VPCARSHQPVRENDHLLPIDRPCCNPFRAEDGPVFSLGSEVSSRVPPRLEGGASAQRWRCRCLMRSLVAFCIRKRRCV